MFPIYTGGRHSNRKIKASYLKFKNNCKIPLFSIDVLTLNHHKILTMQPISKFQKQAFSLVHWLLFWFYWLWCQNNLLSVREVALDAAQVDENVAMWTNLCRTTVIIHSLQGFLKNRFSQTWKNPHVTFYLHNMWQSIQGTKTFMMVIIMYK